MVTKTSEKKLAIIGVGPRGLSALEQFYHTLMQRNHQIKITTTLFETSENLGSGSVWNINQPNSNWLNISERALKNLKGRPELKIKEISIPAFPSYTHWLPENERELPNKSPDRFPPRNKLGRYLHERFDTIAKPLLAHDLISIKKTQIERIDFNQEEFALYDREGLIQTFDEVVLTIGHQPTELSSQLKKFKEHSQNKPQIVFYDEPYPVTRIIENSQISSESTVAIRGFGLAMIDVMRALTIERGGSFKTLDKKTLACIYTPSKSSPKKIVPFSLDGLPLAPKPFSSEIDELYKPTEQEIINFKQIVSEAASGQRNVSGNDFLKNAIAKIAARVYNDLGASRYNMDTDIEELKEVVINWLDDEHFQHKTLLSTKLETIDIIERYVNMALHLTPISLDYCIGQIWHHCQPSWYKAFSHADMDDDNIAKTIDLHERLKRFSYGPPVESMQQMLALIRADVLDLDFLSDPEINITKDGWLIKKNDNAVTAAIMINSVLDAPKLLKVISPIIIHLLKQDYIEPVHSELGIETNANGLIKSSEKSGPIPLAILGRLAKGSVVGVDAILECFGERITNWAEGAVSRLTSK